jgi:hypothetical protein
MIPAVRYLVIFDENVSSRFNFLPKQFFSSSVEIFSNIKLMQWPLRNKFLDALLTRFAEPDPWEAGSGSALEL